LRFMALKSFETPARIDDPGGTRCSLMVDGPPYKCFGIRFQQFEFECWE